MGRNSRNGTRGGRVNRQHFAATTGKRLAAQYFIADANAQLTFSANMLFQWNDKTLRQWYLAQGRTVDWVFISGGWMPPLKSQILFFLNAENNLSMVFHGNDTHGNGVQIPFPGVRSFCDRLQRDAVRRARINT